MFNADVLVAAPESPELVSPVALLVFSTALLSVENLGRSSLARIAPCIEDTGIGPRALLSIGAISRQTVRIQYARIRRSAVVCASRVAGACAIVKQSCVGRQTGCAIASSLRDALRIQHAVIR